MGWSVGRGRGVAGEGGAQCPVPLRNAPRPVPRAQCIEPCPMPRPQCPAPRAARQTPRAECPALSAPQSEPRAHPRLMPRAQSRPCSAPPRPPPPIGQVRRSGAGLCGRRPTAHRPVCPGGARGGRALRRRRNLRVGARYPSEEPLASGAPAEAEPAAARASAGVAASAAPTFGICNTSLQHRASVELVPSVGAPSVVGQSCLLRGFDFLAEIGLRQLHLPGSRWPSSSCSSPVRV